MDHHGSLMPASGSSHADSENADETDLFIVIDATSFLSGRLEDLLRYPQLTETDAISGIKGRTKDGIERHGRHENWAVYNFVLGGWAPNTNAQSLYWQVEGKEPKSVDQLVSQDHTEKTPFPDQCGFAPVVDQANDTQEEHGAVKPILYNLMTPPIPDPMQRVRLLKDLLATLFARSKSHFPVRVLAIDSLSALLSRMDDSSPSEPGTHPGRRLHILNMVRWLEEHRVTSFMACEAVRESAQTMRRHPLFLGTQERYISSGVIQLDYHQYGSGDLIRYLRILKMRGAAHDMRSHAYDLDRSGLSWLEPLFAEPEDGQ